MKIRTMVRGLAIVTICGMMVGCESTQDEADIYGMISSSDIKGAVKYMDTHCECHCQDADLDFSSEDEAHYYLERNCECYGELEGYKKSAKMSLDGDTKNRVVNNIEMCQLLHVCGHVNDDKYLDSVVNTFEDTMDDLEEMKTEEQELNELFESNDQYGDEEF